MKVKELKEKLKKCIEQEKEIILKEVKINPVIAKKLLYGFVYVFDERTGMKTKKVNYKNLLENENLKLLERKLREEGIIKGIIN